jgi:hypothetical protein
MHFTVVFEKKTSVKLTSNNFSTASTGLLMRAALRAANVPTETLYAIFFENIEEKKVDIKN